MPKITPVKPFIRLYKPDETRKLCSFIVPENKAGELSINVKEDISGPDYKFLTELKNKSGQILGFENYSHFNNTDYMTGLLINVTPKYRRKNYFFGEILRLASIIQMLENNISVALDTKEFGTTENTLKYAAPLKSSGWMLPTTGLIIDIFNNLSDVQKDGEKWVLTNSNAGKGQDSTDQDQKVEMINDLKAIFDGVGGGFICEEAIKGKNPNVSEWWWSSTEEDATDAYIIEFKTNGQSKLLDRQKTGNNGVIRPIFAF